MEDYVVFVNDVKVFLIKEDEHFTQKLKERVCRYYEARRGDRKK